MIFCSRELQSTDFPHLHSLMLGGLQSNRLIIDMVGVWGVQLTGVTAIAIFFSICIFFISISVNLVFFTQYNKYAREYLIIMNTMIVLCVCLHKRA